MDEVAGHQLLIGEGQEALHVHLSGLLHRSHQVGTLKAISVNLPLVVGNTSPTAFAALVELRIMLQHTDRPSRQSLAETPPTVF